MNARQRLLLVDDHPMLRSGLKALLEGAERYLVVGEAGTAAAAVSLALEHQPDLMILDLSLPDRSGISVIRDILAVSAQTSILVFSDDLQPEYVRAAFTAGARGYVSKESGQEQLLTCLASLSGGGVYLDEAVSGAEPERSCQGSNDAALAAYRQLTRREQEILPLVAQGLSSRAIGGRLSLSPRTVENHRASILVKLGLRNSVELARFAMKFGLMPFSG